jgi:hypothetical protein
VELLRRRPRDPRSGTAHALVRVGAGEEQQPEHDEREHAIAQIEGRHVVEEYLPERDGQEREPREAKRPSVAAEPVQRRPRPSTLQKALKIACPCSRTLRLPARRSTAPGWKALTIPSEAR